jgi:hypothetical protein
MKTQNLPTDQIKEVKRIASLNNFQSKVANTILDRGEMSIRQADILNEVSEIEIEWTPDIDNLRSDKKFENMQERSRMNQRPSSMR